MWGNPPSQLARANTYMPPLTRPPTVYDTLGQTGPHLPVPLVQLLCMDLI